MRKKYYIFDANAIIAICLSFPRKWESIPYNLSFTASSRYMDSRSGSGMTAVGVWNDCVNKALSYIKFIRQLRMNMQTHCIKGENDGTCKIIHCK